MIFWRKRKSQKLIRGNRTNKKKTPNKTNKPMKKKTKISFLLLEKQYNKISQNYGICSVTFSAIENEYTWNFQGIGETFASKLYQHFVRKFMIWWYWIFDYSMSASNFPSLPQTKKRVRSEERWIDNRYNMAPSWL